MLMFSEFDELMTDIIVKEYKKTKNKYWDLQISYWKCTEVRWIVRKKVSEDIQWKRAWYTTIEIELLTSETLKNWDIFEYKSKEYIIQWEWECYDVCEFKYNRYVWVLRQ